MFLDGFQPRFYFDTIASIWILSRLDDPYVRITVRLSLAIESLKLAEIGVLKSIFEVKSDRKDVENLGLSLCIVVIRHIDKQSFFAIQVLVEL